MSIRTTLTLDDDVIAKLKAEMRRTGRSFKETVNEYLRIGLSTPRKRKASKPFSVRARNLNARPGLSYDSIGELLEQVEGPSHR
ncbi:MAG: hypothetical protein ACE5MK_02425 [Acidobacteriota bacterium]